MGCPVLQNNQSQRQQRAATLVRRAMAELLQEASHFHPNLGQFMLSVTRVHMSPDLKLAKIYVMPLQSDMHQPDLVVNVLNDIRPRLRQSMASLVRMKFLPDIRFYWDDSLEQALKIENLFHHPKVQQDLDHPHSKLDTNDEE